ncbi:hypothetical protein LWP59_30720 [Amycolatopsis acidiphila]|uniref:Uncharacterized protein n=1 Tax=Amycolatopsis acidiphila TaxID=715473 RepID=A0A558A1S1_9PSEU|nr:hypothetical protein [Amycolatopsis acidiphila]TVT18209.1 hypothetical protein FNH06_28430 [Amycolatopsis acidiphila]UIJ58451.1 hypothetical protein LWP59_30720 [Amycolatopsis acidiphila]GHG93214.1 hypothetical protein GCM10017788_70340 [Amycolatopsis acidiphila]
MSLLDRVRDLLRRSSEPELTLDTPGLSVVAEAFDIAEADSAVLAKSHLWDEGKPAVLRHHLTLPADRVADAGRVLAQDGWELRTVSESGGAATLHALRVQRLDALHCAQERSRMAGLAQRLGGDSLGWDALQPVCS